METQLPATVRLKLDFAIDQYARWHGVETGDRPPVPVRTLGESGNNISVVVANRASFVVRINRARHAENDLDPAAERSALNRAAEAGLAPRPRYSHFDQGLLVCDYLPSSPPDGHSAHSREPAEIAALLRSIHSLSPIEAALDLPERIRFYTRRLRAQAVGPEAQDLALEQLELAQESARELRVADQEPVLCHNDLLAANRLFSNGRLWALDWEYAATGSRWFDLAAIIHGDDLDVASQTALVEAYLGRKPLSCEQQMLRWAGTCYQALACAWYALNDD